MPGIIVIGMGLLLGWITGIFKRVTNQKVTNGEIVNLEERDWHDSKRPVYRAVIEYEVDGRIYTIKSGYKSSSFRNGQKVRVAYDELNPENAFLKAGMSTYIIMVMIIACGIIMIINPELLGF